MSTDKSVQNQKVFVTLQSILQFQSDYLQVVKNAETPAAAASVQYDAEGRRHAYESIILTLGLPIQIQPWLTRPKGGQS